MEIVGLGLDKLMTFSNADGVTSPFILCPPLHVLLKPWWKADQVCYLATGAPG